MLPWKRPWGWWQGGSFPKLGGFRRGRDGKLRPFRVVSLIPLLQFTETQVGAGKKWEEPGEAENWEETHRAHLGAE